MVLTCNYRRCTRPRILVPALSRTQTKNPRRLPLDPHRILSLPLIFRTFSNGTCSILRTRFVFILYSEISTDGSHVGFVTESYVVSMHVQKLSLMKRSLICCGAVMMFLRRRLSGLHRCRTLRTPCLLVPVMHPRSPVSLLYPSRNLVVHRRRPYRCASPLDTDRKIPRLVSFSFGIVNLATHIFHDIFTHFSPTILHIVVDLLTSSPRRAIPTTLIPRICM